MNNNKRNIDITIILILYSIFVVIAETIISYYDDLGLESPYLGMGLYISIILVLLLHSFLSTKKHSLLVSALIFPPLIRVLSTSLSFDFQFMYIIIIINILLIITAYLFIKNNKMKPRSVGFNRGNVKIQVCIGLTGVLLGAIEYAVLGEYSVGTGILLPTFIGYALALVVFTGFSEELIFRGIILTTAEDILGKNYALLFVSLLFMTMHIIWKDPLDLLFVFFVALFYGYVFQRTRSLFGISVSHGLSNIMLFLVIPAII